MADWTPRDMEVLARNVDIVRDGLLAGIASGGDATEEINDAFAALKLMVQRRTAMIVPPDMIPPAELAAAVKRGQELAAEHGW